MKKFMLLFALPTALVLSVMVGGSRSKASSCPICASQVIEQGETVQYESGIDFMSSNQHCNYIKRTDHVGFVCTGGHGVLFSRYHYMESHTYYPHTNMNADYWY